MKKWYYVGRGEGKRRHGEGEEAKRTGRNEWPLRCQETLCGLKVTEKSHTDTLGQVISQTPDLEHEL